MNLPHRKCIFISFFRVLFTRPDIMRANAPRGAAESSCAPSSVTTEGITKGEVGSGGSFDIQALLKSHTATLYRSEVHSCGVGPGVNTHKTQMLHKHTGSTCASNGAPLNASAHIQGHTLLSLGRLKTKQGRFSIPMGRPTPSSFKRHISLPAGSC